MTTQKPERDALRKLAEAAIPVPLGNMASSKEKSAHMEKHMDARLALARHTEPAQVIELLDAMDAQDQQIAAYAKTCERYIDIVSARDATIRNLTETANKTSQRIVDLERDCDHSNEVCNTLRAELDAALVCIADVLATGAFSENAQLRFKNLLKQSASPVAPAQPAQDVNAELVGEFGKLYKKYVNLLESGRDRILELGGTCDPVDTMEMSDPGLRDARTALANAKAAQQKGGE